MSELKSCHCGGNATLWTAPFGDYIKCDKCGEAVTFLDFDDEKLKAAWNRRAEQENKPLTLEQLRQMGGKPVWVRDLTQNPSDDNYYAIVCLHYNPQEYPGFDFSEGVAISSPTNGKSAVGIAMIKDYGKAWLAYVREPVSK